MIARLRHLTPVGAFGRVVAILAVLAVVVTGCSSNSDAPQNNAPLPAAGPLIASASATTKTLRDVHLDLSVDGTIPKLPVKSVSAYITKDPEIAGQGEADVTSPATVSAKFVVTAGDLWAQFGPGQSYQNMGPAARIYDAAAILDPDKGVANLIASVRDPKVEGREQIGGVDSVRISGILPSTALAGIVADTELGDRPVTFWLQEQAPNNLVRANVGFDAATLSVTLSDWGTKQQLIDPKTAR